MPFSILISDPHTSIASALMSWMYALDWTAMAFASSSACSGRTANRSHWRILFRREIWLVFSIVACFDIIEVYRSSRDVIMLRRLSFMLL